MKRTAQIAIIVLLLGIATFQLLAAKGTFIRKNKQEVCPVNAIYMEGAKAKIDTEKCIGCGRCAEGFLALARSPEQNNQDRETFEQMSSTQAGSSQEATDTPPVPEKKSPADTPKIKADETDKAVSPAKDSETQKAHYVVDADACISCRLCVRVCPVGAISMVKGKAVIDPEKCINCGICAGEVPEKFRGCPVDAIHPAHADSLKP